jgi:hypothetical protein
MTSSGRFKCARKKDLVPKYEWVAPSLWRDPFVYVLVSIESLSGYVDDVESIENDMGRFRFTER